MHELAIAQNIIEIIRQSIPENNLNLAETVTVKVGKLSNIMPEALLFSFDAIKDEYALKDINLIIEQEQLHLLCKDCGSSFDSNDITFNCRYCGSSSLEIINGDMLQVSEITLKEGL